MTLRLRHTLTAFVLAAALLPMSAAAVPTDTSDTSATTEQVELLRMLNADAVETQERAVRRIGTYAHTGRYDADFFHLFVTPLHGLVAKGETDALRIMAVSALASIGTDRAMHGLKAQVRTLRPVRVQEVTRYAIAQHEAGRAAATKNNLTQ